MVFLMASSAAMIEKLFEINELNLFSTIEWE